MKTFGDNNRRSNRPLAIIITSRLLFPLLLTIIMQGSHATTYDSGNQEDSEMDILQADFALKLLHFAGKDDESAILSPFSVAVALAMLDAGAEGNTRQQINDALANGMTFDEINKHFGKLLAELSDENEAYKLVVANKLFIKDGLELLEKFLKLINETYDGQLEQVNFVESDATAEKINDWVKEKTNSKIQNLISSKMLSDATKMLIINAIYFKGSWRKPFSKQRTVMKPFYISENEQIEVETMHIMDRFPYYEDNETQVLMLPYRGGQLSMCLFLPKAKFGLQEFEASLNGSRLLELIENMHTKEVRVAVPKFKLNKRYDLVDTLKKLGITDAFESTANFRGMSDAPLAVDSAIHQAFIEVNEKGTEAGAATAIGINLLSAMIPEEPLEFIADHPFLFAIVRNDREILFIGHARRFL